MRSIKPFLLTIFCCAIAASTYGQSQSGSRAGNSAFPPPPAQSVAAAIDAQLTIVEKNTVNLAQAMPEDKYNFTPETLNIPGGNYKGVRNFAMQVIHTAAANYLYWSPLVGAKVPDGILGPNPPQSLMTKEASLKLLRDSFALGHRAVATLTAQNLLDQFPVRQAKQTRLFLATFPIIHAYDIYGQMVEYLRMNGKIPPASLPGEY